MILKKIKIIKVKTCKECPYNGSDDKRIVRCEKTGFFAEGRQYRGIPDSCLLDEFID